ncbi:MAG: biotin--[acetyl-CoA-carboxylase] ligase [Candidatus Cloacimonadota bacterium]|nr:MAG: biotin--[acetyl-CoA-carboxylase] ligase [Candidatus Cloacimonadota bacterium]
MTTIKQFQIFEFDQLDSSSDYLKINYEKYNTFDVIWAKKQSHGRGQYDRIWESNSGGLFFSILFEPNFEKLEVQDLILDFSVFFKEFIFLKYNINLKIKSPNDVYFEDKKICGVLIENSFLGSNLEYCIMGIGININQKMKKVDNFEAISLSEILGSDVELKSFFYELLLAWEPKFN